MQSPVAIILAAGKSTRMKSDLPKVLHPACGLPMIEHVLSAVPEAGVGRIVVVVGHKAELVESRLSGHTDVEFALQSEQKGTGHAVMMCADLLSQHQGPVLVLAGDTPLLRGESLKCLLGCLQENQASCVIGTAENEANYGLGRIVRDSTGNFLRIVEQKDASEEEARITEINTGCFAFDGPSLFSSLSEVRPDNSQAEYYLTDCPAILKSKGRTVIAACVMDDIEAKGVNTRVQLADVQAVIQRRTQESLMLSGVSISSPAQTWIEPNAAVGIDTAIEPFCVIRSGARIGQGCQIGPHAVVESSAVVPDGGVVEPFSRIA